MTRHLGEGEIHAWLDGELDAVLGGDAAEARRHLEGCAACRGRVDAEAVVRDRARAILEEAGPAATPLPGLETLRARAGATGGGSPAPAGRLARYRRWGWAASVVVALGVGWGLRDRVPAPVAEAPRDVGAAERTGSGAADASSEGAGPPEPTRPGSSAAIGGDPEVDSPSGAGGPSPSAAPAARSERAAVAAFPERAPAPSGRAAARPGEGAAPSVGTSWSREPGDVQAGGEVRSSTGRPDALAGAREAPRATGAPVDEAIPQGRVAGAPASPTEPVATAESVPVATGGVAEGADAADPTPGDRLEALEAEAPRALALEAIVVTGAPPPDTGAAGLRRPPGVRPARPGAALPAPPAAVERTRIRDAGADPAAPAHDPADVVLTVRGLEVLSVAWTEVAPGRRGVRVLQRLEPADTLELVVIPGGDDDAGAEAALAAVLTDPLRPGWSRVVRVREGARIVARAPRTAAELSRLVEGLGRR